MTLPSYQILQFKRGEVYSLACGVGFGFFRNPWEYTHTRSLLKIIHFQGVRITLLSETLEN
jgi:hypothetical protein